MPPGFLAFSTGAVPFFTADAWDVLVKYAGGDDLAVKTSQCLDIRVASHHGRPSDRLGSEDDA